MGRDSAAAPTPITHQGNPENQYKINRTKSFPALKSELQCCFLQVPPTAKELMERFARLRKNLIRYPPGACKPRPKRPKPHRYAAYK